MSDWHVGENALCIESGRWTRAGCIYVVSDVCLPTESWEGFKNRTVNCHLRFAGHSYQPGKWSCGSRFRRIHPDKREACEPEFVTLLKRSKRKVEA